MAAGRLIGRAIEFAALADACRAEGGIVSLVGPGGVGKTRLALAVADVVGADFEDGCFVVELESVGSAADVIGAIGRTLGLPDDALVERHLRGRHVLLILDNFEQVVEAAVDVARLGVRVLVTSQTPLRVRGERVIRLGPLELPDVPSRTRSGSPRSLRSRCWSRTRARPIRVPADGGERGRRRPHLRPARRAPAGVGARRPPAGPVRPGRAQLPADAGLDALGRGPRDLPPRQRGLRAALDWTCGLLSASELAFFLRLSVFAGGFSSALVEAVASVDFHNQELCNSTLDELEALHDVALVRRERGDRFFMSPPVRLYALERLADGMDDARRRRRKR